MSTKFGIAKNGIKAELDKYDEMAFDFFEEDFIEVAFRSNGIRWANELAEFLPDDLKVYPLDNSAQGIYTIGDIRKEIKEINF